MRRLGLDDLAPLHKQVPITVLFIAGAIVASAVPQLGVSSADAMLVGFLTIALATILAAAVTVRPALAGWVNVIPALDFVAVGFLRFATGGTASFLGSLLLLPAVWMAANIGRRYILFAVAGVLTVTAVIPALLGAAASGGSTLIERPLTSAIVFLLALTMINELALQAGRRLGLARVREAAIADELIGARARETVIADELARARARKSAIADELTQARARKSAIADELTQASARKSAIADELTQASANEAGIADEITQVGAGKSSVADELTQASARESGIADGIAQAKAVRSGIADELTQASARRSGIADELTQAKARESGIADQLTQASALESGIADQLTQTNARNSAIADELNRGGMGESGVADRVTQALARESGIADLLTQTLARESGIADLLTQSLARQSGIADELTQTGADESAVADELTRAAARESAIADALTQASARESAIADELTRAGARESAIAEELTRAAARESSIADQLTQARARESAIADELTQAAARESAIAEELSRAAEVQRALLPKTQSPLPGYEISGVCIPSEAVGGDFFDWYPVQGGLGFTLGDVMGKGVGAGIIAATARAVIRSARNVKDPVVALTRTDDTLTTELGEAASFATLFHARLHASDGRVDYADAGHGLTILVRADRSWERLRSEDPPLGLALDFERTAKVVVLGRGDMIVSFSDGVLDLYDGTLQAVEQVALLAVSANTADEVVDSVKRVAMRASNPDDVTVLAVRRVG